MRIKDLIVLLRFIMLQDLRLTIRSLLKSPGFTAVAVLTFALGIGANTAVFSLVNAVLLRPLPYPHPEQLALVWESAPFFGLQDSPVAPANFVDWEARSHSFQAIGGMEDTGYRLTGDGPPELVPGSMLTAGVWKALQTKPELGRVFTEADDRQGAPKVAVISDGFWRRRFNADAGVLGRTLNISGNKHVIIGVLAPGTEPPAEYMPRPGEIWTPLRATYTPQELADRGRHNWMVIARLKPNVSLRQADQEMRALGQSLAREYPETNKEVGAFVAPLRDHFVFAHKRILTVLLCTVLFVMLIACSNLANLLLSRSAERAKEVALRAALGAGASDLFRRALSEGLVLAAAGIALGIGLAIPTFRFLAHLAPTTIGSFTQLSLDWRVLAFLCLIGLATALLFSVLPLWQFRRLDLSHALKQSNRTLSVTLASRRTRRVLISAEVALAFMLLTGAGLLIRTFQNLRSVDLGCRTTNVLTVQMGFDPRPAEQKIAFQQELSRRLSQLPGVVSVGLTNHVPLAVKGDISGVRAEGQDRDLPECRHRIASPGYLRTMGIPLLKGRDIEERDNLTAPRVAVINDTLARALWPGRNALGQRMLLESHVVEVIGVTADVHQAGLEEKPKPEYYLSSLQAPAGVNTAVLQTRVEPASLSSAVRKAVWSVDPDLPIQEIASMEEVVDQEFTQRRTQTLLVVSFAAVALLLAAVGLYGVLSYLVGRQVPEIGLRMALGADSRSILLRTIGHGLQLTAIGLLMGVVGSLALSRFLGSFLFNVAPSDPVTYIAVAATLIAAATAACSLPARRAMRVDPMVALREE